MKMRQIAFRPVVWGVASLSVLALALVYRWQVYPWRASPPESPAKIETLWNQVESAAIPDPDPWSPAELPALDLNRVSELAELVRPRASVVPSRSATEVGEHAKQWLDALLSWSGGASGEPADLCAPFQAGPIIPHLTLGRLALARSEFVGSDPSLRAALRLGGVLRRRGTLIAFLVGLQLASDAAAWARAHDVPMRGPLADYAPTRRELLSALARDHVCHERMLRTEDASPLGLRTILTNKTREVEMLHWWLGSGRDPVRASIDRSIGFN